MSYETYIVSKSLSELGEIAKGLPSVVRAGGGGSYGEALRSMNQYGRKQAATAAGLPRTDPENAVSRVAAFRAKRAEIASGTARANMKDTVSRSRGKIANRLWTNDSPHQVAMRARAPYMGRDVAGMEITAQRKALQNRARNIANRRPAW